MRRCLLLLFVLACVAPASAQQFSSGLALKTTIINIAAATTTTVVAGVAGQKISVYGMELFCNGANNITILDSTPTTLVPIQAFVASQGSMRDLRFWPWFTTASGTGFQITTSKTAQCSGNVYYTQG